MKQDTVLIRHLPSILTHQEKSDLLKYFGAKDVKIVGKEGKKSNLVYARYENDKAAQVAIHKLHQLDVLGERISAELARGSGPDTEDSVDARVLNITDEKQDKILKAREIFLKKLGLSLKNFDFNQPPPLNIYYQYPPPTKAVLINICKAMANVPKLYTQVLHLMNKMNLPCPFTDNYPLDSDLFQEKKFKVTIDEGNSIMEEDNEDRSMSENESEIGSDSEHRPGEIIPMKRKRNERKVIKRPRFVKPQAHTVQSSKVGLKPNDVFESAPREHVQKKIELKITADLSSIQNAQETQYKESLGGFDVIKTPLKIQEKIIDPEDNPECSLEEQSPTCITSEQLAANRISAKDQKVLPVFKNYQPGAPSCRLYIKNLAKNVQTKDLHFIYRRYFKPELEGEQGTMFDIRLMQEGRMKGQAFITLQSVGQAQAAIKETNGYILKDKPMVVQFARSAAAK